MSFLVNLLPKRRRKQAEESRLMALFVSGESKIGGDGLYPERYTLAEIKQKLEDAFSKKMGSIALFWWLWREHKVSYWQVYKFRKLSGSGDNAVFGVTSWDNLL